MLVFILELNGYRQLQKVEPEALADLEGRMNTLVESRGGVLSYSDKGTFLYRFDDSAEAQEVLLTGLALEELLKADEILRGYILLAEDFPGSFSQERSLQNLKGRIFNRETEESLLLGPLAAEHFQSLCDLEPLEGLFRPRWKSGSGRPEVGKLKDFRLPQAMRQKIKEELDRSLAGEGPREALLIQTPPLSGVGVLLEEELRKITGEAGVFVFLPSLRDSEVPTAELSSVLRASHHSEAEKKDRRDGHLVFLAYLRGAIEGFHPDFPFQEAREALEATIDGYILRCKGGGVTPVLLCPNLEEFSPAAGALVVELLERRPRDQKTLLVFTSPLSTLPEIFRSIPCRSLQSPPLEAKEFQEMLRQLPTGSFPTRGLAGYFKRSQGRTLALYYELAAGPESSEGIPGEKKLAAEIPHWALLRPLVRFLLTLDRTHREVLYLLEDTAGLLSGQKAEELLALIGINRAHSREIIRRLKDYGLPGEVSALPFLRRDPLLRRELIDKEAAAFLFNLRLRGRLQLDSRLLEYFTEKGFYQQGLEIFRFLVSRTLDRGHTARAMALLRADPIPDGEGSLQSRKLRIVWTAKLRLAMAEDNKAAMEEALSQLEELAPAGPGDPGFGEELIQRAMYQLKLRDPEEALREAKKAVLLFQDLGNPRNTARANGIIGLTKLAGDSPAEGVDYFRIGKEGAGAAHPREVLQQSLLEAIAWFVRGNFSRVLEICPRVSGLADDLRQRRWSIAARLVQARAHFELGDFERTQNLLEILEEEASPLGLEGVERIAKAWKGRCLAFSGNPRAALEVLGPLDGHHEALYFAAEAEYFLGDCEKAREKIGTFFKTPYPRTCFQGDAFLWTDAYYFLENLSVGWITGVAVLPNLAKAFDAFLLGSSQENPAAIEDMADLIRQEKDVKNDPYKMLHYYWYARILPEERSRDFEDRTTVLGQAVRHLKSRASGVEKAADAYAFQWKNYWNRQLLEEARLRNLI